MNRGQTLYNPDGTLITDYNKIKVGVKTLDDAVLTLGDFARRSKGITKQQIMKAIFEKDYPKLRYISEYFYDISGLYSEFCNYASRLYRYDWYIIPEILEESTKENKIVSDYIKILHFLDNSYIKKVCGDIALKIIKYGCYYGYLMDSGDRISIQELPIAYCRSRYMHAGLPVVEFNLAYFDDYFPDVTYRAKILKMFPEDIQNGYRLYRSQRLKEDETWLSADLYRDGRIMRERGARRNGWYLLDPGSSFKLNLNGSDIPCFMSVIPSIMDLDAAQDLDRRKQMQQLLKIIVQKLPLDKNGDLIFDIDEARDIHNNAVEMLQRAVGVDVLTTFADVQSIATKDTTTAGNADELERVERQVYNASGISKYLFNAESNLALEKSIREDEATFRDLVLQFSILFDKIVEKKNTNKKKYSFSFYMLETTQYNYVDMAKLYKEQVQLGYSKMLPQIALGHPQSSIINTTYFENEILHLPTVMIPPLMSSTLNGQDILGNTQQSSTSKSQSSTGSSSSSGKTGRPEKPDDQKSEKTIANKESM